MPSHPLMFVSNLPSPIQNNAFRDCAMITRSGAGPKQGGVIQLFIEPEGGSYDFYFGLRGGQTTLFCCILLLLMRFLFVFHA